ncbi:MAG TPA: cytochrome b [Ideonella sp.]|nr:cytochrome b [Ideonella sp.]
MRRTSTHAAPPPARYSRTAVTLHWLLALALFATFCVGFYMSDLELSPLRVRLFNWHKWAGITILALSVVRLGWRLTHARPADVPMEPLRQRLALFAHRAMYALFLAVPLAGWAYSSATGFQVVVFGVLPLPDFVPKSKPLADVLVDVHATLAWTLAALVSAHVAAALQHQFVERDGLIGRMWFAPRRRRAAPARGPAPLPNKPGRA